MPQPSAEQISGVGRIAQRPAKVPPPTQLHHAIALLGLALAAQKGVTTREEDSALEFVLGVMTLPKQEHERLTAAGKLSPAGVAEQIRRHASVWVPRLRRAEDLYERGAEDLAAGRRKSWASPPSSATTCWRRRIARKSASIFHTLSPQERQVVLTRRSFVHRRHLGSARHTPERDHRRAARAGDGALFAHAPRQGSGAFG